VAGVPPGGVGAAGAPAGGVGLAGCGAGGSAWNGVCEGIRAGPRPSTGRGGVVSPHGTDSRTTGVMGAFAAGTGVLPRILSIPSSVAKRSMGK
jgi:hypothetical protein